MVILATCLTEGKTRVDQKKMLYADKQGNVLLLAMKQLIGSARVCFSSLGGRWSDIWTEWLDDSFGVRSIDH